MADFREFVQTGDIPKFESPTFYQPDFGKAIANLGQTAGMALEAYGTQKESQLKEDANRIVRESWTEAGLLASGDAPEADIPAALKKDLSRVEFLAQASRKSTGSRAQAAADALKVKMSDIQKDYIGYEDLIYATVEKISGINPYKFALELELEKEKAKAEAISNEEKRRMTIIGSDSGKVLLPNVDPKSAIYAENWPEIEQQIRQRDARVAEAESVEKLSKLNIPAATTIYYDVGGAGKGIAVNDVFTLLRNSAREFAKDPSEENYQKNLQALPFFRQKLVDILIQKRRYIQETKGLGAPPLADLTAIEDQILEDFDRQASLFSEKKLNVLNTELETRAYGAAKYANEWRRNNPVAARLFDNIQMASPELRPVIYSNLENMKATEKAVNSAIFSGLTTQETPEGGQSLAIDYLKGMMDDASISEEEKNSSIKEGFRKWKEGVFLGTEVSKTMAMSIADPVQINRIANGFDNGVEDFFTYLMDPRIAQSLKKAGATDEEVQQYVTSIGTAFVENEQIRNELSATLFKYTARQNTGSLFVNPATGELSFRIRPEILVQQSSYPGFDPKRGSPNQILADNVLKKINPFFRNLYNALGNSDLTEEAKVGIIQSNMAILGIPVEIAGEVQQQEQQSSAQEQPSLENVAVLEDGTQVIPTSGTTTRAEFLGVDKAVGDLYEDKTNVDTAVKTAWGEGRGETPEGRIAIFEVLRNRALASGESIDYEAKKGNGSQFNVWREKDKNYKVVTNFNEKDPNYETTVQEFLTSANSDITKGATHYYNPDTSSPPWENLFVETARIGKHRFGYLKKDDPYRKRLSKYRESSNNDVMKSERGSGSGFFSGLVNTIFGSEAKDELTREERATLGRIDYTNAIVAKFTDDLKFSSQILYSRDSGEVVEGMLSGLPSGALKDKDKVNLISTLDIVKKSPIAAVGLIEVDPKKVVLYNKDDSRTTLGGFYKPTQDVLWYNKNDPSALLHELAHRSMEKYKDEISAEMDTYMNAPDLKKYVELPEYNEYLVRYMTDAQHEGEIDFGSKGKEQLEMAKDYYKKDMFFRKAVEATQAVFLRKLESMPQDKFGRRQM